MANFKVEFTFVYFSQLLRPADPKTRSVHFSVIRLLCLLYHHNVYQNSQFVVIFLSFLREMRKKIFYNVDYYLAKVRFQLT